MMSAEFEYILVSSLPDYWQLCLKGKVHYSNKQKKCPYCGDRLVKRNNPIAHIHCVGCMRNYVE